MILLIYKIENMKVTVIILLHNLYKTDIWIMNIVTGVNLNGKINTTFMSNIKKLPKSKTNKVFINFSQ